MRTSTFIAASAAALLGSVDAAKLSSFPAYDEGMDLAQVYEPVPYDVNDFAQYNFTPVPVNEEYNSQVEAIIEMMSNSEGLVSAAEWGWLKWIKEKVTHAYNVVKETVKKTKTMLVNIGMALVSVADAVLGTKMYQILNGMKNSTEIMGVLQKPASEITLDDAATMTNQIPVVGDIVKSLALGKKLVDRAIHGDTDACYRTNWEISPFSACDTGRTKFLKFLCMDDCSKFDGYEICGSFSMMCATPKYCKTFGDEIISDLIGTAVTIAILVGTGGGLGIITLFKNVLQLTEKLAHPRCHTNLEAHQQYLARTTGRGSKAGLGMTAAQLEIDAEESLYQLPEGDEDFYNYWSQQGVDF